MDTQANKPATTPSVQLEPLSSVCKRTGMGKSWIYERIAENKFPQIIKIGRRTLFVQQEITDWIEARIEENRGAI